MSVKEPLKGGTAYVPPPDDNFVWYKADNERLKAERDEAVKAEREACAKVCAGKPGIDAWECAAAIRSRGEVQP